MSVFSHTFESIAFVLICGALFAVFAEVLSAVRSMHRPWPAVSHDAVFMGRGLKRLVVVAARPPVGRIDEVVERLAA
jgi:hypothetical protein